ncbi:hypothetical protein [Chroococcus sp. FPU101]|uniref:hypothetical protein n=1 Tax=Chroococcus sp. FPU101 TaxID=1974212 RepID=UPI001A906BF4|nr:hypothetical protein [Chroococcus sp. FPU101]GFE68810.1 hypothetical protein CFPU101_14200 [Chroococcus sp. FPU101]
MVAPLDINPETRPESQLREIQDAAIGLAAKNLNPTILSVEFLKYSGIIPADWELSAQPVMNPNFAQINFQNGVSIVAQPRTITFTAILNHPNLKDFKLPDIASNFIEKLPHAEYQGVGITTRSIIPFPSSPDAARQYITRTLLSPGPWQDFGLNPVQAGINYLYQLDRCQFNLNINEAKVQLPDQRALPAVLFAGNFNYTIETENEVERLALLKSALNQWDNDLRTFSEIVHQRFLGQQISVFPSLIPN